MKYLKYMLLGIFFGIVLTKAEIVSWFRIQEMFRFQSFHMYGVLGSAVGLGIIGRFLIQKLKPNSLYGKPMAFFPKEPGWKNYLLGGALFGMGWALVGACPGPIVVLIGNGYLSMLLALAGALLGVYAYGALRHKLPH